MGTKKQELTEKYLQFLEGAGKLDIESGHVAADSLLCDLLDELGYSEITEEYNKYEKWYS